MVIFKSLFWPCRTKMTCKMQMRNSHYQYYIEPTERKRNQETTEVSEELSF